MDANYHNLSGGAFTQDWSNAGLITTNEDWSGVPSITGYLGRDDSASVTGVDPQTILSPRIDAGDVPPGEIDVVAQSAPTNTSGGVAEFDALTDRTVALQGSGTADSPFIVLNIDATSIANVRVSYRARDVDNTGDNSVQQVALQYRTGAAGDFTNVPGGYIADATTGPGVATLVTDVSQVIPGNAAQLQIRIITTNAAGSDEWVGIDDIRVEDASVASAGQLRFSAATYTQIEGNGNATITVSRLGGSTGAVSVRARTVLGGTATADSDYTVFDQVINFADAQNSATFDIVIADDGDAEIPETVFLELLDPTGGATLGSQTTATLTIGDNDAVPPAGLLLNEVNSNPPGANPDNPFEYVEIRGSANQPLFNTYFVSVEGDSGAVVGGVTLVQDLSSSSTGSNGLLMIKSPTGGFVPPSGTTVVTNTGLDTAGGGLQNGSNSFLIVFSPTPLAQGQDLDTNDDGTLDLPSGASLIDGVSWLDGSNIADRAYGNAVLTLTTGLNPPDAATRFVDNNNQNNADAWFFGDLEGLQDSITYAAATVTTTNPGGIPSGTVVLTPGAANYNGTGGTVTATAAFVFDAFPTLQTITVQFSGDVSASLDTSDITLTNVTTSAVIPAASIALSYNSGTNTASFTFPSFSPNGSLPDGNYTLSLPAGNVTPNLDTNLNFSFFAFAGDANRDRVVDIGDFSTLAANFNQTPRTFSSGDFDYTGIVDIGDFSILAAKFNQSLPAPAGLPRAASAPLAGVFGSKKIDDSLIDLVA